MGDDSERGLHIEFPASLRRWISKTQAIALDKYNWKIGDKMALWLMMKAGTFLASDEVWGVDPNSFEQHIRDIIEEHALGRSKRN